MPRSLLYQPLQVGASPVYDDTISSPHTAGVAEGQVELNGDLNVLRTLMKDLLGATNWYDTPEMSIKGIADKYFIELIHPNTFDDVATGTGTSSTAFDTAIKAITGHNNGGGTSIAGGVIVNATKPYRIEIRDHDTQNPIDDGGNNEVYGRLTWSGTQYVVNWYSYISGTETAYNFVASVDIDMAYVALSRRYEDLNWDVFLNNGWHDVAGPLGTIDDSNVTTGPWSFLLTGKTTAQQAFDKIDKLGSTASGEGASGVAIYDLLGYYTGLQAEAALQEIATQLGGTNSTTYNFTENNVLADNDTVYPALNKLDLKWGDLASAVNGEGASLVGVEDAGGFFAGTDVEAVLQEIGQDLEDVSGWKKEQETAGPISSGAAHTLPNSLTYTLGSGANLDVYFRGQLLTEGAANDYIEDTTSTVKFNFTVPASSNLIYCVRK